MAFFNTESSSLRSNFLTFIKFVFFLGLGILIIWLSIRNLTHSEKQEIINSFRTANYNWVILAILLGILSHVIRALRWMLLLEPMAYKPSFKNTFYAVMVGYFANMAFPRLGEVTRCGVLAKYEKVPFNKSFGTVITERALDMIIFFLLFLLMIFTQIGTLHDYLDKHVYPGLQGTFIHPFSNPLILGGIAGFIAILILLFVFLRKKIIHSNIWHKFINLLLGFWEGFKSLSQIRKPVLFIFYSLAIWFLYFLMLYLCFFCFEQTSELGPGAGLSSLVLGSIGIMITPGGIGLYPAIIQETLLLYGLSRTTGLALGWIAWTAQTAMIFVVGGLSLILLSFNKNPDEQA
ncbi:MAG: lysylphosphatidylglycerol synthase transmembrane domain-containing protein [Bacteroidetes bacterium]|nr:lysylphosphatidylglycerol synthase transmembrane domain-containing protein [Bacteroidota bacterium]